MALLLIILGLAVLMILVFVAGALVGSCQNDTRPTDRIQWTGQQTMADIDEIVNHYTELQQVILDLVDGQH